MYLTILTDKETPGIYIFAGKIYRIVGIGQQVTDAGGSNGGPVLATVYVS